MRWTGLIAACVLLAGCGGRLPPPTTAFDANAAAYIHTQGTHRIEGQAFYVTRAGSTRLSAGETVRLVPATPYARERFAALYQGKKFVRALMVPSMDADAQYVAHSRTTTTTSSGNFKFHDVAPGDYFVTAQKIWRPEGSFVPEGGAMYEEVSVREDDRKAVNVVIVGRWDGW